MGQYYKIINTTKKEFMRSNGGVKLMEFSWEPNGVCLALKSLMLGRWKNDQVLVVGDYAHDDPRYVDHFKEIVSMDPILKEIGERNYKDSLDNQAISAKGGHPYSVPEEEKYNLYSIFDEDYSDLGIKQLKLSKNKLAINFTAYNHTKKQYFNSNEGCFEALNFVVESDEYRLMRVDPLNLLLAVGNGLGGGDYREVDDEDYHLVGSWAFDQIELVDAKKDPHLVGYTKINPAFSDHSYNDTYGMDELPEWLQNKRSGKISDLTHEQLASLNEMSFFSYIWLKDNVELPCDFSSAYFNGDPITDIYKEMIGLSERQWSILKGSVLFSNFVITADKNGDGVYLGFTLAGQMSETSSLSCKIFSFETGEVKNALIDYLSFLSDERVEDAIYKSINGELLGQIDAEIGKAIKHLYEENLNLKKLVSSLSFSEEHNSERD
jgi:hypothetical protein